MLFVVVFALALLIALVIAFDNALDRGLNLALFLDTLLPFGSVVALHTLPLRASAPRVILLGFSVKTALLAVWRYIPDRTCLSVHR